MAHPTRRRGAVNEFCNFRQVRKHLFESSRPDAQAAEKAAKSRQPARARGVGGNRWHEFNSGSGGNPQTVIPRSSRGQVLRSRTAPAANRSDVSSAAARPQGGRPGFDSCNNQVIRSPANPTRSLAVGRDVPWVMRSGSSTVWLAEMATASTTRFLPSGPFTIRRHSGRRTVRGRSSTRCDGVGHPLGVRAVTIAG